ncbi:MAG TPA: DUF2442 domain-containing protein [Bacteroidia bacterium]|nr:DUF2442 domain-containing protein [Bacteroidia bacterium]
MKTISIINAEYLNDYKLKLFFNDGTSRIVDFKSFLAHNSHPQYDKYKHRSLFKKFKIVMGNIVWGRDWDLIFPVYDLYKGKI